MVSHVTHSCIKIQVTYSSHNHAGAYTRSKCNATRPFLKAAYPMLTSVTVKCPSQWVGPTHWELTLIILADSQSSMRATTVPPRQEHKEIILVAL